MKLLWIYFPCTKGAAQGHEQHSIRESLSWWAPSWVSKPFFSVSDGAVFMKTTLDLLTMHASVFSRPPLGIVKPVWDHRWRYCITFPPLSWNAAHFGSSGFASVLKGYLCCSGGSYMRCLQLAHHDAHGLHWQKRAFSVFKVGQILSLMLLCSLWEMPKQLIMTICLIFGWLKLYKWNHTHYGWHCLDRYTLWVHHSTDSLSRAKTKTNSAWPKLRGCSCHKSNKSSMSEVVQDWISQGEWMDLPALYCIVRRDGKAWKKSDICSFSSCLPSSFLLESNAENLKI